MKNNIIFLFLFLSHFIVGQTNAGATAPAQQLEQQSKKLKKAIAEKDDVASAESFVDIADTYYKKRDYSKSESFYEKALDIYKKNKDKDNIAKVSRALALVKEAQNDTKASNILYEQAADNSENKSLEIINRNDASRLSNNSLKDKEAAAMGNVVELKKTKDEENISQGYEKLGEIQMQQQNYAPALESFNNAYQTSKTKNPEKALEINSKIARVYVEEKNIEQAIAIKKQVLEEPFVKGNSQAQVTQLQEIATLYNTNNKPKEALNVLEKAYQVSLEKGHTLDARNIILKIDSLNRAIGTPEKSMVYYRQFLNDLKTVISKDKALIDEKIIAETEEKIAQLLKEKNLQDALIQQKNNFNLGLILFVIVLILAILAVLYAYKKLQIKNKKIALQSLRREMNPHFIFNSLNSVNHFIAQNNELAANQYLAKFSKLMRGIMENSTNDFIPLNTEIEVIQNYLALEKSRFHDKFDYALTIDERLQSHDCQVPSMLVQPFIENAIWHGIRYLETKGLVEVSFSKKDSFLEILVKDNGIGMAKSLASKTKHQKAHNGRAMNNTLERMRLLNDIYNQIISHQIIDSEQGVTVILKIKI